MKRRLAPLLAAALVSHAVPADDVLPWVSAIQTRELAPDEKSLWQESDEFDQALLRSGKVNTDPALTAYMQGILDTLYPEFKGRLRIRLLNAQQLNAFALPNGSLYINAGLVARFQNEAQLATVLAHEGAHFTHRHALQQAGRERNAAVFALMVAMAGVPLVGDVIALSSMFGFSREHESQADEAGYQRLAAAGYDPKESIRTFEHLQAEIHALDIDEPFFFASHPKLQDRIDNYRELCKDANGGELGRERFVEATAALRLASLDADLAAYRYQPLILVLADPARRREYPPETSYYLGEALRLRNEPGDLDTAEREYTLAIEGAPQFAPSYRALALLYYKRGEKARAVPLFRRYLELAPAAADRGHVEFYLKDAAP